jgi:hypothetical protein
VRWGATFVAGFTLRDGLAGLAAACGGFNGLFVDDRLLPAFAAAACLPVFVGLEALAAFAPFVPFDFDAFVPFDAFETFVFAIRP